METSELVKALNRLKVETGSLVCLGCGHEHNCGVHGCAVLREAIRALEDAEGKADAAARTAKHYKEQRDAAVKQLRKIADCGTCRKDRPEGVDGPECVAMADGMDICVYCQSFGCNECIVNEWKSERSDEE